MQAWKTYPSMISQRVSQEAKEWFIAIISLLFQAYMVDQHLVSSPLLTYLREKCKPHYQITQNQHQPNPISLPHKTNNSKLLTKKERNQSRLEQNLRIIPQMPRSFIKAKWVGTLMRDSPTFTYFINYHYSTNATFLCKIQQRLKPKTNLLGS